MSLRSTIILYIFDLLYTHFAWAYDAVSWAVSRGRWQSWGRAALPFLIGPEVLELGHGPGHLLATLEADGWMATGIDISSQMGRLAKKRLAEKELPVCLARGRAQDLPFRNGTFDSVVATFPASYIIDPETARAIREVLRPGGRLVVVWGETPIGKSSIKRLLGWLFGSTRKRIIHISKPSSRSGAWGRIYEPAGFVVTIYHVFQPDYVVTVIVADRVDQ